MSHAQIPGATAGASSRTIPGNELVLLTSGQDQLIQESAKRLNLEVRWSALMMIHLHDSLESAVKLQANALGVSPANYVQEIIERDLASSSSNQPLTSPFTTGYGSLAKFGVAPSAEEIDANRAEMFGFFGKDCKRVKVPC